MACGLVLKLFVGSKRPSGCPLKLLHIVYTLYAFLQMEMKEPQQLFTLFSLWERQELMSSERILSLLITQVNYFLHEEGDPHGMQPSYLLRSLKSLCQTELSQHIIVISFILMEIGHYHVYN